MEDERNNPIAWRPTVQARQALLSAVEISGESKNGLITQAIEKCYLNGAAVSMVGGRKFVSVDELASLAAFMVREAFKMGIESGRGMQVETPAKAQPSKSGAAATAVAAADSALHKRKPAAKVAKSVSK